MAFSVPDWNLYRTFIHALKEGSLSAAARALGTTQPTVGRQIDALEAALGITLFTRTQDGLAPTEAAQRLAEAAEGMALLADAIVRDASAPADDTSGTVRIAASHIVGAEVLPPMLTDLHRAWPHIAIELSLSNRNEDMVRGAADIAVRMMRPEQGALVAKRLGTVRLGLYAHRDYLRRHGTPRDKAALARHVLIGYDRNQDFWPALHKQGLELTRADFAFRCDSEQAQLAALRAGMGIGICQIGIARRDPVLTPVLAGTFSMSLEMWLAMHRDMRGNRRVKLVYDYLAVELAAYAAGTA
jgi:DNA-binding transcriptional LysR family regulator